MTTRITMAEAVARLRSCERKERGALARELISSLDDAATRQVATPKLYCAGRRCDLVPPLHRHEIGGERCWCGLSVLAQRLLDRARRPDDAPLVHEPTRFHHTCVACGVVFDSPRKVAAYCLVCLGEVKDMRRRKTA